MDSTFKPAPASAMDSNDPFFEQIYQAITPGLMTPLDDWTHSGLFDNLFNTSTMDDTLIQDAFLTSPCATKDYLCLPSSPPEDLFNALSTPNVSPVANNLTESDISFVIDSLVIPGTPMASPSLVQSPALVQSPVVPQSAMEMVLTLDSPPPTTTTTTVTGRKSSPKQKAIPPAAAQPVTSHITSASTPTFALKQPAKKRSAPITTTTTPMVSTELALKRQKNTDAARRSRQKKLHKMETLAGRVSDLESIHHTLMSRVASLESDKAGLLVKENAYLARIQQLETDLALAQQKLMYP